MNEKDLRPPEPKPIRWQEENFIERVKQASVREETPCIQILDEFVKYFKCQERCMNDLVKNVNKIFDSLPPVE